MTQSRPVFASVLGIIIAACCATPMVAQDMSRFLDPAALADDLGLSGGTYTVAALQGPRVPRAADIALSRPAPSFNPALSSSPRPQMRPERIAALASGAVSLAPSRSAVPVPRGGRAQTVAQAAPRAEAPMEQMMQEARAAAPEGANVAVIVGAETAVVNGQVVEAEVAVVESTGWWQRIFGG